MNALFSAGVALFTMISAVGVMAFNAWVWYSVVAWIIA